MAFTFDCLDDSILFILGPIESKTVARFYSVSENACLSCGVYTSTHYSFRKPGSSARVSSTQSDPSSFSRSMV